MTDLSIIVPVLNEAAGIPIFHSRLVKAVAGMNLNVNIIYVNDGSTDATQEVLNGIVETDSRVTACELSRNFGHQAALSAGLEYADGRLIVMLDGDGQHPPELIGDMIRLQSLGYDIVQCQRIDGANSASVMKRLTARLFYLLLKNVGEVDVPAGSADFRLITQDVLKAFKSLPEYHRFIRGMIPWLGFRSVLLPYQPGARLKGETRYSVRKMLRLAADGVFSFSLVPLRLGLIVGSTFLILGIAEITYVLAFWFSG